MGKIKMLFALVLFSQTSYSQLKETDILYTTIKKLDSLVFDEGFNKCNLTHYNDIISNDLEFYHDEGGITAGKDAFMSSIENNICKSEEKRKRELLPHTMKVYPMYNDNVLYGLLQEGNHEFFRYNNGKWNKTTSAKFTHLWILDGSKWKLKKVLSYNHQSLK